MLASPNFLKNLQSVSKSVETLWKHGLETDEFHSPSLSKKRLEMALKESLPNNTVEKRSV